MREEQRFGRRPEAQFTAFAAPEIVVGGRIDELPHRGEREAKLLADGIEEICLKSTRGKCAIDVSCCAGWRQYGRTNERDPLFKSH